MGYIHYTNEKRQEIVDSFHKKDIKLLAHARNSGISPKTLYLWLENDGRPFKYTRPRIKTVCKFSFNIKKLAISQILVHNINVRQVANDIGVTYAMVYRWLKVYKSKGEYALMSKSDLEKGSAKDTAQLLKQIEELKEENFRKQLKIDAYEAAQRLLKNYPALSLPKSLQDLTNSIKAKLISELRAKYKVSVLLELFAMKPRTYYDNVRANLRSPKYMDYDNKVLEYITQNEHICGKKGYREVMHTMRDDENWTLNISERRIRVVMKENNLLAYQTKSGKPYNSYKKDGNPPAKNWLYDKNEVQFRNGKPTKGKHYFTPKDYWEILGTDVTEFNVNGLKIYFSPVIDFMDSMPVAWRISKNPNEDLIVGSVQDAIKKANGKSFVLHMDRGSVNRSKNMKATCQENHVLQSMSDLGRSCDNAPTEGFFGRLKQEWFHKTDFTGYTFEMFVKALNDYIFWCLNKRHCKKLGWLTPAQYRSMVQLNRVV